VVEPLRARSTGPTAIAWPWLGAVFKGDGCVGLGRIARRHRKAPPKPGPAVRWISIVGRGASSRSANSWVSQPMPKSAHAGGAEPRRVHRANCSATHQVNGLNVRPDIADEQIRISPRMPAVRQSIRKSGQPLPTRSRNSSNRTRRREATFLPASVASVVGGKTACLGTPREGATRTALSLRTGVSIAAAESAPVR